MEQTRERVVVKFGDQDNTMDIGDSESDNWNKIVKVFSENRAIRGTKNSQINNKGGNYTKKRKEKRNLNQNSKHIPKRKTSQGKEEERWNETDMQTNTEKHITAGKKGKC